MKRARVELRRQEIDAARADIEATARALIPDYHFLDHRVSLFWTCDLSPIGMCVFLLDDIGRSMTCRYCHGPEERK